MKPSTDGILLIDSSLTPVYANQRAIEIFSSPGDPAKTAFPDGLLAQRIRGLLTNQRFDGSGFVSELRIGRMRYSCQAFRLDSPLFLILLRPRPQTSAIRDQTSDLKLGQSLRSEVEV